ncbi:uncharacterized protein LOC130391572 isoform X2 [Gadus chalcogrammus]|uniref:uncharacterized protein LOC130391572 isoform X2 n=1 Tax=Gadus chalcogrammus TaxID=1042646 RepID=UPI0024C4E452|nr:uncharacterized protein LOC130391572 isoform X2 [Gadus chalcogrammus]
MQSLTQTLKTGPEEPLLPLTECDAMMQPGESETHVQLLSEIVNQPPHSVGVTQENEKETLEEPVGEPMVDSEGREIDPSLSPGSLEVAPGHKPASASDVETMGKIKEANDGRRYLSCMKNRRNPLLMEIPELDSSSLILDSSPLSLQCRQCHIIFNHYKSKERHLRSNHPLEYQQSALKNTLFTCYVCDHHFANSTELMTHQKAHVEKRPYKCPICGEAFYRVSELTGHKKIHFGEDGYACTTCGKACKTLTLLKYHQRKHTGEKPYACKECGKRFGFSKDVRKHMESHLQGQEGEDGTIPPPKAPGKKINSNTGVSTIKYPCSLCKATFKSIKTRLCHNKKKHKFLLDTTTDALPPKYPVKQGGPIITPISISQSTFLQVEPLQQVNANIDTEQIRKLIESMENVQRVNQVVILGQVPPHIPTQGLQFPAPGAPVYLNPTPPSIEHSQTEHSNSLEMHFARGMCNYMDQTIILEPITPPNEGLEYPSFQELVSKRQSEVADLKLKPEETLVMELTSALLPVADLEKSESSHQLVPSSSLVLATELEKSMDETVNDQDEITPPGQLLVSTVELDKTPLEAVQEDLINGPLPQKDKSTQLPYETPNNPEGEVASQIPKESIEQAHSVMESMPVEETQETHSVMESMPVEETPEPHSLMESMPVEETQEQIENGQKGEETLEQPTVENISSQEQVPLQSETKQVDSTLDSTVNVMSAQELVKVRKRRPARTFVYEEYIYQQMVSTRKRHLHTGETSAKQQPTKKSPHVIEFGPKNKEKKNQNQRKRSQSCQSNKEVKTGSKMFFTNMSEKPVAPKKNGRKSTRKHVHLSSPEDKLSNPVENIEQQGKDKKTNKLTKRKQVVTGNISKEQKDSPALKKNKIKKVPSPKLIDLNIKEKCKKVTKETDPTTQNTVINKGSINVPAQEITPDPFLLLKGHKQPQLKVYKLDPSKAAGQTQEYTQSQEGNEDANMLLPVVRKRAGRPKKNQKAFSLLSSLVVNDPSPTTAHKPKTTRKRKSSLRIETEGVITASNSKRALECKDCGEKFNSVSSLQEHKTSMHIVESPGLTFTNGNLFEGVSGLVHQPTNKADGVIGEVSGPSYWDIEAETREVASEDKECTVSFPALNPSPSLPITEAVEASGSKEKTQIAFVADITALLDVARQHREPLTGTPLGVLVNGSPQLNGPGAEGSLASDLGLPTGPTSEGDGLIRPLHYDCGTEMKITAEDDVKDEVLLDVDIVTVGEQNEMDPPDFSQPLLIGDGNQEVVDPDVSSIQINNEKTTEITFHSSSSSSTHSLEFKKEQDVESVVQKRDKSVVREVGRVSSIRGRGSGRREGSKRGLISRRITDRGNFCGRKADEEPDECQIIFQKCPLTADSELNKQDDTHSVQRSHSTLQSPQLELNQDMLPALCVPPVCSSLVDKQSEFGVQQDKETDQSAIVIPERFVTSRRMETADKKRCHLARVPGMVLGQVLDSEEIKVEDGSSSIRPDLVKQGKHLILRDPPASEDNVIIQWNVEQMDSENIPETESQAGSLAPDVHTKQCIFYPVKEEEREVLLCPSQREDGVIALELSSGARVDHQTEDEDNFSSGDHQETRSEDVSLSTNPNDSNTAIAQGDMEEPEDRHVCDFLLQIPEEDDSDLVEYCDPLPAPEEQAVAYLNSLKKRNQVQLNEKSLPTSEINQEDMRQPIDLFSTYFGWDTWGEIARCTNSLSKMLHLVTAKEVAQFVGIHIAMGTLKFPSLKLYWQDPTKVSLIADAMPLSRFLQLAHKIKLALPEKDLTGKLATQRTSKRQDVQPTIQSCSSSISSRSSNSHSFSSNDEVQNSSKRHGDEASNHDNEMNPLWRLQTILHRFDAGCQLLKPEEEYAVDQFPIPLSTGKENDNVSLNCTVFIGVGGLITKLKLGVNLSDKEDAVERMAPRDSLVYLCRQDLSTPAMLERLLNAGVHGAGRVGGAIGQMGDEFISSDGRLRLRRSKGGFVLSTAGKEDQNVSELIESLERSQMLVCLNRDLHHLYRIPHTDTRSTGWPQGVLWFLTDLALVNSWLLYRQGQRTGSEPLTLMAFRLEVSKALIFSSGLATQDSVPPQPPSQSACVLTETPNPDMRQERSLPDASIRYDGSGHWPEQFEVGEGGRCRFGNCNRTSQVLCLKCCVFLCISRNHNCFMKFHNQQR